jgi:hypothetical protein
MQTADVNIDVVQKLCNFTWLTYINFIGVLNFLIII